MDVKIRTATAADKDAVIELLPRLADFDVPKHRNPDHLWQGDATMFGDWLTGSRPDVETLVAHFEGIVVGVAMLSIGKELLSGEPSAHLEVLAVAKAAEGKGIGSALMVSSERLAIEKGAKSMSLHVFANNMKARALYERKGFDGELLRYSKVLKA